jgi:hypothetical protein
MSVKMRRMVEQEIVEAVVDDALKAGFDLQVYADGEDLTARSGDRKVIVDMLMDLDDAFLKYRESATPDNEHVHWVRFVFGNDGWDVISDYLTSLDETDLLKRADAISKKYED